MIMLQYRKCIVTTSIIFLLTFSYTSALYAGSIKLSWNPPTANMDGTTLSDLAGYKIYYGTESNVYLDSLNVGNVTSYRVKNLVSGNTYYFTVTAYDRSGNESQYSNEVSLITSSSVKKPSSPKRLRLTKNLR
ncbi:MAG: fibronectin type III domain-containing protein [Nitrospiraceae bacterium]|nr:MAG: fibronectin type III domain-containing protein [Nitrospiraceae bacterium]